MKTSATDSGRKSIRAGASNTRLAVWVLTPNALALGRKVSDRLGEIDLFFSDRLASESTTPPYFHFKRLGESVARVFNRYRGHLFIMATGIVVRVIAPLIRHKIQDPAVLVLDEGGRYVISLLSGHLGGANRLALKVADLIGATAVITTATDVNRLPSVDLLADQRGLFIQNPAAIKSVNMAVLTGETIRVCDPFGMFADALPKTRRLAPGDADVARAFAGRTTGVYVGDREIDLPDDVLILRPGSLAAGIGCNRGTPADEIRDLLFRVLKQNRLSPHCLHCLATIDVKQDEAGLQELARQLDLPLQFFPPDALKRVEGIQSPSAMVEKHIGVKSVCEAAAILATRNGQLIVPKQTSPNVTAAIARITFT